MSGNLATWYNVPPGSVLCLWVGPAGGRYLAQAKFDDTVIPHDRLVPGEARTPFDRGTVVYSVTFQSAAAEQATMQARVEDPAGNVLPESNGDLEYSYTVRGKAGDAPARATLVLVAARG